MHTPIPRVILLVLGLAGGLAARDDGGEVTAVSATVHNHYARSRAPDGSFQPESYAFGEGGCIGTPVKDKSVDELPFRKIAHLIAPGLARQNYVPGTDPEKTGLLVMVYWGSTGSDSRTAGGYVIGAPPIPPPPPPPKIIVVGSRKIYLPTYVPSSAPRNNADQPAYDAVAGAQNRERDRENLRTARLLGFAELLERYSNQPGGRSYLDLIDELEDPRYFVILRAYDFQRMWQDKQPVLLWEVRYSIRSRDRLFDRSLGAMTAAASRSFGQASKGLVRQAEPGGDVKFSDPVFKETYPDPK